MTTSVETSKHYVPEDLPTHIQHYINGQFVDSVGGKTFDVLDPVSNRNYATAAAGQKEDIDLAVAAATRAFKTGPWPRMKPRERARVLNRIAGSCVVCVRARAALARAIALARAQLARRKGIPLATSEARPASAHDKARYVKSTRARGARPALDARPSAA